MGYLGPFLIPPHKLVQLVIDGQEGLGMERLYSYRNPPYQLSSELVLQGERDFPSERERPPSQNYLARTILSSLDLLS